MDARKCLIAIGIALVPASCAGPDRTDYAIAASHHANWARIATEGAATDEAASRSLAAKGDQSGAEYSAKSATEFSRKSQQEQFQAEKDRWLSQWWPSLPAAP